MNVVNTNTTTTDVPCAHSASVLEALPRRVHDLLYWCFAYWLHWYTPLLRLDRTVTHFWAAASTEWWSSASRFLSACAVSDVPGAQASTYSEASCACSSRPCLPWTLSYTSEIDLDRTVPHALATSIQRAIDPSNNLRSAKAVCIAMRSSESVGSPYKVNL